MQGGGQGAQHPAFLLCGLWPIRVGSRTGLEPNPVQQTQPRPHQSPTVTLMLRPQLCSQVFLLILESSLPFGYLIPSSISLQLMGWGTLYIWGKLRHTEAELAKATQELGAVQVLAPTPASS